MDCARAGATGSFSLLSAKTNPDLSKGKHAGVVTHTLGGDGHERERVRESESESESERERERSLKMTTIEKLPENK